MAEGMEIQEDEWGNFESTPSRVYAPAINPASTGNTLPTQAQAQDEAADLSALPETLLPIEHTKTGGLSAERLDARYHLGTKLIGLSTPDTGNILDSTSLGNPECREARIVHPHVAAELGEPQTSLDLQRKLGPLVASQLGENSQTRLNGGDSGCEKRDTSSELSDGLTPAETFNISSNYADVMRTAAEGPEKASAVGSRCLLEDPGASLASGIISSRNSTYIAEVEKVDGEGRTWEVFEPTRPNSQPSPRELTTEPGSETKVTASTFPPLDGDLVPASLTPTTSWAKGRRMEDNSPRAPPAEKVDGDWATGLGDPNHDLPVALDHTETGGGELGESPTVDVGLEPLQQQAASTEYSVEVELVSVSGGSMHATVGDAAAVGDAIDKVMEDGEGGHEQPGGLDSRSRRSEEEVEGEMLETKAEVDENPGKLGLEAEMEEKTNGDWEMLKTKQNRGPAKQNFPEAHVIYSAVGTAAGLKGDPVEKPAAVEIAEVTEAVFEMAFESHCSPEAEVERTATEVKELLSKRRDSSEVVTGRWDGGGQARAATGSELGPLGDVRASSLGETPSSTEALAENPSGDLGGESVLSAAIHGVDWGNLEDSSVVAVEAERESQRAEGEPLKGVERGTEEGDGDWSAFGASPALSSAGKLASETPQPTAETLGFVPPQQSSVAGGDGGDIEPQYMGDIQERKSISRPEAEIALLPQSPPSMKGGPADAADALTRSSLTVKPNPVGTGEEYGWGAFDETPIVPTPASRAEFVNLSKAVPGPEEEAVGTTEKPSNSSSCFSSVEVQGGGDCVGSDDGDNDNAEQDDQEWSDFGDFEEAPTTGKAEPPPPQSSAAGPSDTGQDIVDVRSDKEPESGTQEAGSGERKDWKAFVGNGTGRPGVLPAAPSTTAESRAKGNEAANDAGSLLSPSERDLAIMLAVFEGAFPAGPAVDVARGSMADVGVVGIRNRAPVTPSPSLPSLADLAHLVRFVETSCRQPGTALNGWTKSCILRGIRPVPDAPTMEFSCNDTRRGRQKTPREMKDTKGTFCLSEKEKRATPAMASTTWMTAPSPQAPNQTSVAPTKSSRTTPAPTPPAAKTPERIDPEAAALAEGQDSEKQRQQRQEKIKENYNVSSAPVPAASFETTAFASFPPALGPPSSQTGDREIARGERLPEVTASTPRQPPPSVPSKENGGQSVGETADGSGDRDAIVEVVGGKGVAVADDGAHIGPEQQEDSCGDAVDTDDFFDEFQSAPAVPSKAERAPPAAAMDWIAQGERLPEVTAPTPRQPPPNVLSKENGGQSVGETADGSGDRDVIIEVVGGKGVVVADDGAHTGPELEEGSCGDAVDTDDLFDEFQSAPAVSSKAEPAPPAAATDWNLDFFMAAASKGGGMVKSVAGSGASVMSGAGADLVKPLDLVSQALAGFGIDGMISLPRDSGPQGKETIGPGGPLLSPSDTGRPAPVFLPGDAIKGGTGGGVELKLSELLLSRRKRTKQATKSTMSEPLSAAAQARLAVLPDLSFMLSNRLRFPMRAVVLSAPFGVE